MSSQSKLFRPRQAFPRALRTLCHASALVFGAFWLVATTALPEEPRECFTGIAKETNLRMMLGSPISAPETDGGTPTLPSCNALDGLAPGAALTFHLSQTAEGYGDGLCHGYETRAIEETVDVTLYQRTLYATSDVLTHAEGR